MKTAQLQTSQITWKLQQIKILIIAVALLIIPFTAFSALENLDEIAARKTRDAFVKRYGDDTTVWSVSRTASSVVRYTWTGVGTNPEISTSNLRNYDIISTSGFLTTGADITNDVLEVGDGYFGLYDEMLTTYDQNQTNITVSSKFATWAKYTSLEDSTNSHIWQPRTLAYKDIITGAEVWRLSGSDTTRL